MKIEFTNPESAKEMWLEQARQKWQETDLSARQYWLTEIAKELSIMTPSREHFLLVMKHKAFGFDKLPKDYQEILAQKWGFLKKE